MFEIDKEGDKNFFSTEKKFREARNTQGTKKESAAFFSPSDIVTLPKKFLPSQQVSASPRKRNIMLPILLSVLVVLVAVGGFSWYYFRGTAPQELKEADVNIAPLTPKDEQKGGQKETPAEEDVITNEEVPPLIHVAKGSKGETVGILTLELAPEDRDKVSSIQIVSFIPAEQDASVVGALYQITPQNLVLEKQALLTIEYSDVGMTSVEENSLRIGFENRSSAWTREESSEVDLAKNKVSLKLQQLPQSKIALVANITEEDAMPPDDEQNGGIVTKELIRSLDSDEDDLTDVEEIMYGTQFEKPDTDEDGFFDGEEIANLYSPLAPEESLLASGLVEIYTNSIFQYQIFYPKQWTVNPVDEEGAVVMFTSPSNQFVEVVVEERPPEITDVASWYMAQVPGLKREDIEQVRVGKEMLSGIKSTDGSTVYIIDGENIIAFSYHVGIDKEADYVTTWQMMIRSWQAQ